MSAVWPAQNSVTASDRSRMSSLIVRPRNSPGSLEPDAHGAIVGGRPATCLTSTLKPGQGRRAAKLRALIRWAGRRSVVLATSRASMTVISVVAIADPTHRCRPALNGMNSCGAGR